MKLKLTFALLAIIGIFQNALAQTVSNISTNTGTYNSITVQYVGNNDNNCIGFATKGVIKYKLNGKDYSSYITFDNVPGDHYQLFDNEYIEVGGTFTNKNCTNGSYNVFYATFLSPKDMRQRQMMVPEFLKKQNGTNGGTVEEENIIEISDEKKEITIKGIITAQQKDLNYMDTPECLKKTKVTARFKISDTESTVISYKSAISKKGKISLKGYYEDVSNTCTKGGYTKVFFVTQVL